MTEAQKIIKYIAIAFGFFLVISIFSSIFVFLNFFDKNSDRKDSTEKEINTLVTTDDNILELNIDVGAVDLIIKDGEHLIVETNNEHITYEHVGSKLTIKEKKHSFLNNKNNKLIITLPSNIELDVFEISSGAGKIEIDILNVSSSTQIDGGAGEITINNGSMNNLDLDMGVGKVTINSKLLGNTDIDAGVGELNINLLDSINSYSINTNKGLGSITLNGENITNVGNGMNRINIDGAVGSINITTIER